MSKDLTVWKKEEVALTQRGPDNLQEEMSTSQTDLEDKSKHSTLQRTLVICLRRCPHPPCPDSQEKEMSSPQRDFDCQKEIRSTPKRTLKPRGTVHTLRS